MCAILFVHSTRCAEPRIIQLVLLFLSTSHYLSLLRSHASQWLMVSFGRAGPKVCGTRDYIGTSDLPYTKNDKQLM